jgi:predicted permease
MFAWVRRLRARIRYRKFDDELRRELDAHRGMLQDDLVREDLPAAEARSAAARTLGNVTLAREQARGVWIAPWLESLWQDLRYGVRSLKRSPAFTLAALLTMTIGIGLSTAIFTTVNAVILRPWPIDNPDEVVLLTPQGDAPDRQWGFNLSELEDFASRTTTLSHVAASRFAFLPVTSDPAESSMPAYGQFITPSYFPAVGVTMRLGRNFRPDENQNATAERVVIISHSLWQRVFGGDEGVIGRNVYLQKQPYTVIGVTREGWRGGQPYRDDVWLPLQALRYFRGDDELFAASQRCCVEIVGRLAPGATADQVENELTWFRRQLAGPGRAGRRVSVTGTSIYARGAGGFQAVIPALVALATILVLMLTGANVAHLQLARAAARAREIRTRLSLGAGRARIVRQLVTEALLLAAVAGLGGLGLVYALITPLMQVSEFTVRDVWTPDLAVFTYAVAVSLLMSVTFSLLPALRSTRVSLAQASGPTATPAGRLRFNLLLLSTQIAMSVALLSGASLLTRSLIHATSGDAGFELEGVNVVSYRSGASATQTADAAHAMRQSIEAALSLSTLPPVAVVARAPFNHAVETTVRRPDEAARTSHPAHLSPGSSNVFAVLGIPLVEGRTYSDLAGADEAVVNQRLARTLWPQRSAIGQQLVVGNRSYTVVGVTGDVFFSQRESIRPTLHVPFSGAHPVFLVRGAPAVGERIKGVITAADPHATVIVTTLSDVIAARLGDSQTMAQATWMGSVLALSLATFGVFGVFAHVVEARRREIGIRLALGGQKHQVLAGLFRTARLALGGGLAVGLVASVVVAAMLEGFLYGLSPFDPVAFGLVAMILGIAAALATIIPARRALAVDPAVTLRQE